MARVPRFVRDLKSYRSLEFTASGKLAPLRLYPCLSDHQAHQSVHGFYFYQDCWAARQVFIEKPEWGVDVGSTVLLVGILSQFAPWYSIDIRPLQCELDGLKSKAGSVLDLPFNDDEVPCLTTMCVLEHIGLGRYGDPLNPTGTYDAVQEIRRVIRPQGIVVFSVPVGVREILEFNANRRFSVAQALDFFNGWDLVDSCILTPSPKPLNSHRVGELKDPIACFCFRKPS
jgi:Caenorhabditis protein of unknown function, DUF268